MSNTINMSQKLKTVQRDECDREHDLVSCALFCFNQAEYVEDAVRSVLAQDYPRLEVVLSDDASTDGSADVIRRVVADYKGPHRVVVNVNQRNLGVASHVNLLNGICKGRLIVAAAGDDVSLPQRTRAIHQAWVAGGRLAQSFYSSCTLTDRHGVAKRVAVLRKHNRFWDRRYVAKFGGWVLGATEAWTKELFSRFGPLRPDLLAEDHAIHFRAAMSDGVVFLPEPLVRYRWGIGSWRGVEQKARGLAIARAWQSKVYDIEYANAVQAAEDLQRLGDLELIELAKGRLRHVTAMRKLVGGPPLSPSRMCRAIREGARLGKLLQSEIARGVPGGARFVSAVGRIRRR